jgi:hypothetical protein
VRRFVVVNNCPLPLSSGVAAATTRGWVNAPPPLLDPCLSAFRSSTPVSQSPLTSQVNQVRTIQWARFARTRPLAQDFVLCAPRWLRYCPDCGKAFRNGAAMRKHAQTHAPKGQFPCQHCPKLLKTTRCENTSTPQLEHPHQCPVCDKRFQNRSVQHHRTHNADDETAQQAASRVGAEVMRLAQAIRVGPAEAGRPTVTCTTCKATTRHYLRARRAPKRSTGRVEGWPAEPPGPKCVACLEYAGKSPSTLAEAALGRAEACGSADSTSRRCNPPARRQGHKAGRSS